MAPVIFTLFPATFIIALAALASVFTQPRTLPDPIGILATSAVAA